MRSTVCLTTAPMRTGKTYMRGAIFLAKEWLPFHEGLHVSNMPMKPEALAEYCTRHYGEDRNAQERVIRIPDEMLAAWRRPAEKDGLSGTWKYMDGPWDEFGPGKRWPLSGTHIAIDEAHLYIPSAENLEKRRAWRNWLRELGHHGATVEFITQNLEGLDKQVDKISEIRYTIASRVSDRDPFLRIPMADWYELKGKLIGEWRPWIKQYEKRRVDKGWQNLDTKMAELRPEFFELYESFSRPQTEDGDGAEAVHVVEHQFQKSGWAGLLMWFARRNFDRLLLCVVIALGGVWLTIGGGIPMLLMWFLGFVKTFTGGGKVEADTKKTEVAAVAAPEGPGLLVNQAEQLIEAQGDGFLVPVDTVIWSGAEGEYKVSDVAELMGDREFLETQTQVQAEELALLRREAGDVILLTPTHATFSSGERVAVGAPILRSGNDGQTLTAISYQNRQCLLSDGSVLTLRMSEQRRTSGLLAGVQGGGRGERRDQGDGSPGGRDGDGDNNGGGRHPNGGNDAGLVGGDGSEHDMGTGARRASGEPGGSRRSPGSGPGTHSTAVGGGTEQGREPILSGPTDAGGSGGDGRSGGTVGQ